jgi:rhodanese-related sulfurtransferase
MRCVGATLWLVASYGCSKPAAAPATAQTPEASATPRALVAAGATLLDVRTAEEFAQGHLEGAINIPVDELASRTAELGPHDQALVVYCASGRRSARASQTLRDAGFTAVHDLGAMSNW